MKKYLTIGIAFFVIFILVSHATAVPASNEKSVENFELLSKDDFSSEYLDSFDKLLTNMNPNWIDLFFDFIWDLITSQEFQNKLDELKEDILEFIFDEFNNIELAKQFFEYYHAFEISEITKNIESIRQDYVIKDVQSLLKPGDNIADFTTLCNDKIADGTELLEDYVDEEDYPKISNACITMGKISKLWAVPILLLTPTILEGFALLIINLINAVVFSIIITAFCIWIALREVRKDYPEYFENPIINQPKIIVAILKERYMKDARTMIFTKIIMTSYSEGEQSFSEVGPTCSVKDGNRVIKPGKKTTFVVYVEDLDEGVVNGAHFYRDEVQIGFDWNGDKDIDYWSPLINNYVEKTKTIRVEKKWDTTGTRTIYCRARDQWGVTSDWYGPITVKVETKSKENSISPISKLVEQFPMLKKFLINQNFLGVD